MKKTLLISCLTVTKSFFLVLNGSIMSVQNLTESLFFFVYGQNFLIFKKKIFINNVHRKFTKLIIATIYMYYAHVCMCLLARV